jgi:protein TonB
MFEDSTFESAGRIRTRSRRWMVAAFTFNASILLAFVLVPLLCLEALPRQALPMLITVPPAPHEQEQRSKQAVQPTRAITPEPTNPYTAPRQIPQNIYIAKDREPAPLTGAPDEASTPGGWGGPENPFHSQPPLRIVHPPIPVKMRVSTAVEEGLLIHKTIPAYPPIALTARTQGMVVLAATISKSGNIENLRVVSGPALLQQAALDAVQTWRYRPYLLDGQPVEVETTVNVVFTMSR